MVSSSDLLKAIGEEKIDIRALLTGTVISLSERRVHNKWLDCIILDLGLPRRLFLQSTPTDIDEDFEMDVLTLRYLDKMIEGEEKWANSNFNVERVERITTDYEGRTITAGIRLVIDSGSLDVMGGNILASVAVRGMDFPAADFQPAFPLSEYSYVPW